MAKANFRNFQHYKYQKIMTYFSIIYSLLTCIRQHKSIHIKLPVPITDAKTMLNFSTLHKLHHKK